MRATCCVSRVRSCQSASSKLCCLREWYTSGEPVSILYALIFVIVGNAFLSAMGPPAQATLDRRRRAAVVLIAGADRRSVLRFTSNHPERSGTNHASFASWSTVESDPVLRQTLRRDGPSPRPGPSVESRSLSRISGPSVRGDGAAGPAVVAPGPGRNRRPALRRSRTSASTRARPTGARPSRSTSRSQITAGPPAADRPMTSNSSCRRS